jgi:hypothetical protein
VGRHESSVACFSTGWVERKVVRDRSGTVPHRAPGPLCQETAEDLMKWRRGGKSGVPRGGRKTGRTRRQRVGVVLILGGGKDLLSS